MTHFHDGINLALDPLPSTRVPLDPPGAARKRAHITRPIRVEGLRIQYRDTLGFGSGPRAVWPQSPHSHPCDNHREPRRGAERSETPNLAWDSQSRSEQQMLELPLQHLHNGFYAKKHAPPTNKRKRRNAVSLTVTSTGH